MTIVFKVYARTKFKQRILYYSYFQGTVNISYFHLNCLRKCNDIYNSDF